jgi:hypothetical protein
MYKKNDQPSSFRKLIDDLNTFDVQNDSTFPLESDMVSLILSGVLQGEDLSKRYPEFYKKLLENANLRQAFLDALESIEAERNGDLVPMPGAGSHSLDFLDDKRSEPAVESLGNDNLRLRWKRTLEQIQAVFSPQELAYRAALDPIEEPWFTLLRDELSVSGSTYAVALECTLSNERENALSTFLNLAVTLGDTPHNVQFPLRASLNWGDYQESVLLPEEGRARFPDILLSTIFDASQEQVRAGLTLTLETSS